MKVGVTATQQGWTVEQADTFLTMITYIDVTEFHHGDCIGGDCQAALIVRTMYGSKILHCHPPTDSKKRAFVKGGTIHKELPYLTRNIVIAEASEILFVIPRTAKEQLRSGTWQTYRVAKTLPNCTVHVITPDGAVS